MVTLTELTNTVGFVFMDFVKEFNNNWGAVTKLLTITSLLSLKISLGVL
jgi:hypothetical protein